LHNPALQGLDPFDPNLTLEQMAAIAVEAHENFWYFIREIARAPAMGGAKHRQFRANRGNMALFWSFLNHIFVIHILPRQSGKSFSSDLMDVWLLCIKMFDTDIHLLTKDSALRTKNIERIKDIAETLPFYLNPRVATDIANTEEFTVKARNNSYHGHLPNKSPKAALNVGRGLTTPVMKIDEAAFIYNIAISMPTILAAGTAARDIAKANGQPYGTVLTTTAGKKDDPDGKYIFDIVDSAAKWSETFLDARNEEELEKIIRANSRGGFKRINASFNHKQLGLSDEWLRDAIEETGVTGEELRRDFLNEWTSGSLRCPLPLSITEAITKSIIEPKHVDIDKQFGYMLNWYIEPHLIQTQLNTIPHILALDTSDAVGSDDIALVIRNVTNGKIVGTATVNETNLIHFASWFTELLIKYTSVTAVIERRSTGSTIIDYIILKLLEKDIDPFKRLFNRVVQDAEEDKERFKEINKPMAFRPQDVYVKYKKAFGFSTSGSGMGSRHDLYSETLLASTKTTAEYTFDDKLAKQLTGLVEKNGRIDHSSSGNDDLVIGYLLSYWLIAKGRNLDIYGIDSRTILADVAPKKQHVTALSQIESAQQKYLKEEIESLIEKLKLESQPLIMHQLELRLRWLSKKLTYEDGAVMSIDSLINQIKEERQKQTHLRRLRSNMGFRR
jgi:hypothetical protein